MAVGPGFLPASIPRVRELLVAPIEVSPRVATALGDANPLPRPIAHHLAQHCCRATSAEFPANSLCGHGLVLPNHRWPRVISPILAARKNKQTISAPEFLFHSYPYDCGHRPSFIPLPRLTRRFHLPWEK